MVDSQERIKGSSEMYFIERGLRERAAGIGTQFSMKVVVVCLLSHQRCSHSHRVQNEEFAPLHSHQE